MTDLTLSLHSEIGFQKTSEKLKIFCPLPHPTKISQLGAFINSILKMANSNSLLVFNSYNSMEFAVEKLFRTITDKKRIRPSYALDIEPNLLLFESLTGVVWKGDIISLCGTHQEAKSLTESLATVPSILISIECLNSKEGFLLNLEMKSSPQESVL